MSASLQARVDGVKSSGSISVPIDGSAPTCSVIPAEEIHVMSSRPWARFRRADKTVPLVPRNRRGRAAATVAIMIAALALPVISSGPAFAATHVANPFVGATQYLSPDYTAEAQATADGGALGAAEAQVASFPTAVWMDKIGAIAGDSVHHGLQYHLDHALAQQQGTTPITFEVVIYDRPGRDCAALASNGEIPATAAGLTQYETQYID